MRQAIVEIVGTLIIDIANEETPPDGKKQQKQINGLFSCLFERVLDISPYIRAKVFAVLARIIDVKKFRFPKQRLLITSSAVAALDDKSATVRKAAAALLGHLILTHPYYHTHGGSLQRELFADNYKEVTDKLAKIESAMGKAVNNEDNEHAAAEAETEEEDGEDDEEDNEEDDDNAEGVSQKKKKKKWAFE